MQLDSRQTSAFLAVAKHASFDIAAQHLHLTSSALSQRIKALELQLSTILFVRSRPCRLSPSGQRLLTHLLRLQGLEQDMLQDMRGEGAGITRLALAINADSLDTWFLPALANFAKPEQISLDICVDDQDHTHQLLAQGQVSACISTEASSLQACQANYLGTMRYQAACSSDFYQQWFSKGVDFASLRLAPIVNYNRKDQLQARFMSEYYDLQATPACHYIPASTPFNQALSLGLGWGMVPELMLSKIQPGLQLLAPDKPIDLALYWHCWTIQSLSLNALAQHLAKHSKLYLRP